MFETAIGLFAALFTSTSYIPQVWKCWKSRQAGDLSLKMLIILACGLSLWVLYGFLKSDWVIVLANSFSLVLLFNLIGFKLIGWRSSRR